MRNVSVECAEALAVRAGLLFRAKGSIEKLIVEYDNKRMTDTLNDIEIDNSSYFLDIISDCHYVASRVNEVS